MTVTITAWSAISPFGYGRAPFVAGVNGRVDTGVQLGAEWDVPNRRAHLVPDFDVRAVLGGRRIRAMDRVGALALAAAGRLLDDLGERGSALASADDVGLVLGTTTGSVQSMTDFTRSSLEAERPFYVEAASAPVCVMNYAAGQVAIRHGLRGPNVTIAAGRATGLAALTYARRLLLAGRARKVLCGAAEEFSRARAWLDHHGGGGRVLGEGCALLLLEPEATAREPLATVVAVDSRCGADGDTAGAVAAGVRRLLAANGVHESEVWAACGDEQPVLREIFGDEVASRVPSAELIGDTAAASAVFQIAAMLSVASADSRSGGAYAVVTAAGAGDPVACALLRLPPAGPGGNDD